MDDLQRVFESASRSNDNDRELLLEHPEWLVLSDRGILEGRIRVAVVDDGTVVGFATSLIIDGQAELEDLFVDPAWMRHGIGTALVVDLSARLKDLEIEWMEVTANPHALAFYEHLGFMTVRFVDTLGYRAPRMRRPTGVLD